MSQDLATIDAPQELREHVAACVRWSQENTIATAEQYEATGEHLKSIKSAQKQADAFFDPPIKQAHELHKTLVARKKIVTDPLATSESMDKSKRLTYQQAEQRKAEDERRKAQAVLDAQAAAERAKIEESARKQREIEAVQRAAAARLLQEAVEADAESRKRLLAEAAAAERKADKAAAAQDVKNEQAAAVVAPVVAVPSFTKTKGISTVKTWTFEVLNKSKVPADFLIVDEKKLGAYARAMKEGANVEGVRFFYTETESAKGR